MKCAVILTIHFIHSVNTDTKSHTEWTIKERNNFEEFSTLSSIVIRSTPAFFQVLSMFNFILGLVQTTNQSSTRKWVTGV